METENDKYTEFVEITKEYSEDAIIDKKDFVRVLTDNIDKITVRLIKSKVSNEKEVFIYEITAIKQSK